ncbi:c-type cytochrome [Sphingomonas tabacisoli]|uniref:C-type cytochrome n=1 Tax=Sphingomonas tabacisoli TaxID=2249466 RepID=A0ABW4HZT3_9SPHN
MRSLFLLGAAGAIGIGAATATLGQTAPVLPAGPGHDVTVRVCSGCHAPEVAARQRLSKQAWAETVDLMASRGAQATDAELAQIVDYLSTNFPASAAPAQPPAPSAPHG